jgi:hypothetical protein
MKENRWKQHKKKKTELELELELVTSMFYLG